jgi:hypothetical protein
VKQKKAEVPDYDDDGLAQSSEPALLKVESDGTSLSSTSVPVSGESRETSKMLALAELSLGLTPETASSSSRLTSVKQSRDTTMGGVNKVSCF